MYTDDQLRAALFNASLDWIRWRADYEHDGAANRLPILVEEERYVLFLRSYGPFNQRTPRRAHLEFRDYLLAKDTLNEIVADETGRRLDDEAAYLGENFPELRGRPVSALSKLAMFAAPGKFPPYDSFAAAGLRVLSGRPRNYADYVDRVHCLAAGDIGRDIANLLQVAAPVLPTGDAGFKIRIVDSLLMQIGGRSLSGS
jgi:hypothetical protein